MIRKLVSLTLVAVATLAAGSQLAVAGEKGTVKAQAAWVGKGSIFQVGEEEALFVGAFGGILYIGNEEGVLDRVIMLCPGTVDMSLKNGDQNGDGKCVMTDKEGDRVFAIWDCDGQQMSGCEGSFKLNGSTGKFKGISGESVMKARTAMSEIVVDLKSGMVAETGAGLLVLPELNYSIP